MDKKKNRSLRNEKLRANRASATEEQRKEREDKTGKSENRNPRETAPGHSQKIKGGGDNELKSNLRLEKLAAGKQLRLALEREEERRTRLKNDASRKVGNYAYHSNLIF